MMKATETGETGMAVETRADLKDKILEEMDGKVPKGLQKTWDKAFAEGTSMHQFVQLLKDLATALGNGLMGATPDRDLQKSILEHIVDKFDSKDNKTMHAQAERDLKELNKMGVKGKEWNKEPAAPVAPAPTPVTAAPAEVTSPPASPAAPEASPPPAPVQEQPAPAAAAPPVPSAAPQQAPAESAPPIAAEKPKLENNDEQPPAPIVEASPPVYTAHTSAPASPPPAPPPAQPETQGPLDRLWGTLKRTFTGVAGDIGHTAGVAADVARNEVGIDTTSAPSSAPANQPAESSRKSGVIHPAIRDRIQNFDAENLAGPYVTGEAQLGRNLRGAVNGRINQEMQRITSGIPILGDFARSAGNNMQSIERRQAMIAEMVIKADELADKADALRAAGKTREADATMNRALGMADRADDRHQTIFGNNGLESRHGQNAVNGAIFNETTNWLNKNIQQGGLPGFIRGLGN